MKQELISLAKDPLVKRLLILFVLIIIMFTVILIWRWNMLPPQMPLFYSLPRSEDQLGTPLMFLLLPLLSIILFVFNFLLAIILYKNERLACTILIITATVLSFLLFITFMKIIMTVS